jgi:hypothetical protein
MVRWARIVLSLALLSSAELLLERWHRGGRVADLDAAIERPEPGDRVTG